MPIQTVYVAVQFWHHFNRALRFDPPICLANKAKGSTGLATWPPTVTRYADDMSLFSATSLCSSTIKVTSITSVILHELSNIQMNRRNTSLLPHAPVIMLNTIIRKNMEFVGV